MKAKAWKFWLIIVALLLVSACTPQEEQELGALPTLAVVASLTPSQTYTPTRTPTDTPTATSTATATPTPTFTPSLSPTVTLTVTPSISPTNTLTSTPLPTNTPIATNTPTLTATPNAPQIISFTTSANNVTPNAIIVLRWVTVSDTTRIDVLNQQGAVTQTFATITPSGELSVSVPGNLGRQVIYRLVAVRGGQEVMQSLPIGIACPIAWFFGDVAGVTGCPTAVGATAGGGYQPFERGLMIYVTANGINKIYGLQNQDSRYTAITNGWDGSNITLSQGPPSGLLEPQKWFRWAFVNTLAPVGTWENAIGWATSSINEESRTIQFEEGSGAFYIDTSGGGVYRFSGGDSGTWTKIK